MDSNSDKIVEEVKSRGVFDKFRKDLMADIDTKPAYLNLIQRVQNTVSKFLSSKNWSSDMNKIHMRDRLRRHIADSNFLDLGVERIVDQVVNPKISTCFQPQIEDIAYEHLGIDKPGLMKKELTSIGNSISPHLPSELNGILLVNTTTSNILPEELEQISPDSDKTNKSYSKGSGSMDTSEDRTEDFESPEFEPLENISIDNILEKENTKIDYVKEEQESNLSQISSLSMVLSDHSADIAANISEEAQMPKFNDNSCSATDFSSKSNNSFRGFSFDINKEEIKFEGTTRKLNVENVNSSSPILSDEKSNSLDKDVIKNDINLEIISNTKKSTIKKTEDFQENFIDNTITCKTESSQDITNDRQKCSSSRQENKTPKERSSSKNDRVKSNSQHKEKSRHSERSKSKSKKANKNHEKKDDSSENCSTTTKQYRRKSTDSNDDGGENINGNKHKNDNKILNDDSSKPIKSAIPENKENSGEQECYDYEEPLYYFDDIEMSRNMDSIFNFACRGASSSRASFYKELNMPEDTMSVCSQKSSESLCSSVASKKRKSNSSNTTRATLIIDCIQCDSIDQDQFKAKKFKTSPTSSDTSLCSKENECYGKHNTNDSETGIHSSTQMEKKTLDKRASNTANQRYSTHDLYKPRPILSQRSRRRGMDTNPVFSS